MTKMLHLTSVNPGQGPPGEEGLGCCYRTQTRLLSKLLGYLGMHIQKHYTVQIASYSCSLKRVQDMAYKEDYQVHLKC